MKATKFCGIVAGIVLLYVLSIGPAYAWHVRSSNLNWRPDGAAENGSKDTVKSRSHFESIYAPVYWLGTRHQLTREVFNWYNRLWLPREPIAP
jgi:hypothetical protein